MQNPYAMERFVREHDSHARAVAELQALRRQAIAARRRETVNGWLGRLGGRLARVGRVATLHNSAHLSR
jgi:hypothetical protein